MTRAAAGLDAFLYARCTSPPETLETHVPIARLGGQIDFEKRPRP